MDEEKSNTISQTTFSTCESDETDSDINTGKKTAADTKSLYENNEINDKTVLNQADHVQSCIAQNEIATIPLNGIDRAGESCSSIKQTSINSTVNKPAVSIVNSCGADSVDCEPFINNVDVAQDNLPQNSFSHNDANDPQLTLANKNSSVSSDSDVNNITEVTVPVVSDDAKSAELNEQDTVVNRRLCLPHENEVLVQNQNVSTDVDHKATMEGVTNEEVLEATVALVEPISGESTDTIDEIKVLKIEEKPVESTSDTEAKASATSTRSPTSYNSLTSRPTLADDSRLVKISLPANPINIMQSNAQFLNKSRNFLNFITEKSTNIMERTLLPQNFAVKYNSMMKSMDSTYSGKKTAEEAYINTGTFSTDMKSELDQTINDKTISNYLCTSGITQNDKIDTLTESTVNHELQSSSPVKAEDKISANIEQNERYSSSTYNSIIQHGQPLSEINDNSYNYKFGPNEINKPDNTSLEKVDNFTACTEINGDSKEDFDDIVLNTENNSNYLPSDILENGNFDNENAKSSDLICSKQNLLHHPAYLMLLRDYAELKGKNVKLQEKVEHLEQRNQVLEAQKNDEIVSVQMETLEKTIDKLTCELRASVAAQEVLKKEYNAANKERESMVMKYAVGEKQLIDTQRARDCAERKLKEVSKEQELLQNKLRQSQGERTRICTILDGKCREITDLQKEMERLKEDVKMREVKLKWTQTKLKTEMDLQKETQQKLDRTTARINEMKEECDQVRREAQETMRKFQQSEENKAVTLDQQLKEQQARLILERHVTEDKEMLRLQLQKEVEALKHRQQVLIEENNTLSLKVQDADKNRLNYETNFNNLKAIADQRQKEIVDLLSKVSGLETLKVELQHKKQCLESAEAEMEHLRQSNEELQSDMFSCRQREADMLDFTQKLTDKNVRLQSDYTAIEAQVKQLEEEHGPLHARINELLKKIKMLEEKLAQEQRIRIEECEILANHLAEQTQLAQNLAQKLEDSQGENAVLKRKQQISMKEMTRELQQCRKRLEAFETASPCNSLEVTSRTGSNVSLNAGDTLNGALSDNSANGDQPIQSVEPSRQALIDRIIKLQKINVKRAEKLDFLEEHAKTLVEELQKKTKIIQNYILHESFGAMGSNERDRHKAELARYGGIMASVYNQKVSDDHMTLELSLEINQKLQAGLEDALLKNITLKDNIDTLGEEIARLTMQIQQRQVTK